MVPQENHNRAQVCDPWSHRGTRNLPIKLVEQGNCLLRTCRAFCKKSTLWVQFGEQGVMLFSFSSPQTITSLYTVLLTMSWPDAPGTALWADSTHPASKTRGCSPRGKGPGLAHRRGPAAPAAATSRDRELGWGEGIPQPLHHLPGILVLVLFYIQHANRSERSGV